MAAQSNAAKPPGRSSWTNIIPTGLSKEEKSIYDTLLETYKQREGTSEKAPNIVVITDLAKDYDDLAAMVVLKELHRLGLVKLLGFVANLRPAYKRAVFGRAALDELGLKHIPIAIGTDSIDAAHNSKFFEEHGYEFDCSFYENLNKNPPPFEQGSKFLKHICTKAKESDEKITFLLLSPLQDISEFCTANPDLFKAVVKHVVLQGGYAVDPSLSPDEKAANNLFHRPAAKLFHTFMDKHEVKSTVWTKHAAYETSLTTDFLANLAATGHVLGEHLAIVQKKQDLAYWKESWRKNLNGEPKHMSPERFLRTRTTWYEDPAREIIPIPAEDSEDVLKYMTKVLIYDALAALGAAGQDVMDAMDIKDESLEIHEIVGVAGPGENEHIPGIKVENMKAALKALMMGSLLAANQKLTT